MVLRQLARLAVLALLLVPLAAAAPLQAQTKRAPADWSKTVTATPKGAFILGNPNAKTRLVEYMSYSCPHCADFAGDATAQLKAGWIRRGVLSIEYRNFIRDGYDLTAALIARCGGAPRFLANHEAIFASFDTWIGQAQKYAQAHGEAADNADRAAQFIDIADGIGLTALAGRNGIAPAAAHKCLADPAALATVLALTAGAWDVDPDFEGTPTFVLDGKVLRGVHAWQGLKPLLPPLPTPLPASAK